MNLLESNGARPNKQPLYTPIFMDRMFTGIWTNRSPLHDPSDVATARFYGGRPDALWQGSNVELFNQLWLGRRPGLTPFSTSTYPSPPDRAFSFELTNGTIQVIVDTSSTGNLALSAVDEISGVAYYQFAESQPISANNGYVDLIFQVVGFDQANNNGTFTCTASTATYLVLDNSNATTDVHSATTNSSGAVYYDNQGASSQVYFFATVENPLSDDGNFSVIPGFDAVEVPS